MFVTFREPGKPAPHYSDKHNRVRQRQVAAPPPIPLRTYFSTARSLRCLDSPTESELALGTTTPRPAEGTCSPHRYPLSSRPGGFFARDSEILSHLLQRCACNLDRARRAHPPACSVESKQKPAPTDFWARRRATPRARCPEKATVGPGTSPDSKAQKVAASAIRGFSTHTRPEIHQ